MGSITAEVPGSIAAPKSKRNGTDSLEAEAIGLDVSVRIHGSQVAAVVLDTTEHVEPFEEDSSTMIVFPRGAVVKLRARVRTGHAVVLTNLTNKQTALCRIVQVNSGGNVAHYVKLEFIQPAPGFWGVHFPSDDNSLAAAEAAKTEFSEPIEKVPGPAKPVQNSALVSVSPTPQSLPPADAPRSAPKPIASEMTKETPKPAAGTAFNYGISADVPKDEVVPLAAAPSKRMPTTPKAPAPIAAPAPPTPSAANTSTAEAPIFDSLSTGEEIFGREAIATSMEESVLQTDKRAAQAFMRSLDSSSLLHGAEVPKRHTGLKIVLTLAAAAIVAAGAVYYVRQYRGSVRQSPSIAAPTGAPAVTQPLQTAGPSTNPSTTSAQTAPQSLATSAPSSEKPGQARSVTKRAPIQEATESTITVTPVHNRATTAAQEGTPTISNGVANIYAGDLSARPQATQRSSVAVNAPAPAISSPSNLGTPSTAGLGSLVSGPSTALPAPPKPEEPKPMARGGEVASPRLIHSVQPVYPSLAMTNHIEGDVQIQAMIDQAGKVTSTKVLSGPTLLRVAAMEAVRQWKYSPATLDGKPIMMQYKVTVRFRLAQ